MLQFPLQKNGRRCKNLQRRLKYNISLRGIPRNSHIIMPTDANPDFSVLVSKGAERQWQFIIT